MRRIGATPDPTGARLEARRSLWRGEGRAGPRAPSAAAHRQDVLDPDTRENRRRDVGEAFDTREVQLAVFRNETPACVNDPAPTGKRPPVCLRSADPSRTTTAFLILIRIRPASRARARRDGGLRDRRLARGRFRRPPPAALAPPRLAAGPRDARRGALGRDAHFHRAPRPRARGARAREPRRRRGARGGGGGGGPPAETRRRARGLPLEARSARAPARPATFAAAAEDPERPTRRADPHRAPCRRGPSRKSTTRWRIKSARSSARAATSRARPRRRRHPAADPSPSPSRRFTRRCADAPRRTSRDARRSFGGMPRVAKRISSPPRRRGGAARWTPRAPPTSRSSATSARIS